MRQADLSSGIADVASITLNSRSRMTAFIDQANRKPWNLSGQYSTESYSQTKFSPNWRHPYGSKSAYRSGHPSDHMESYEPEEDQINRLLIDESMLKQLAPTEVISDSWNRRSKLNGSTMAMNEPMGSKILPAGQYAGPYRTTPTDHAWIVGEKTTRTLFPISIDICTSRMQLTW